MVSKRVDRLNRKNRRRIRVVGFVLKSYQPGSARCRYPVGLFTILYNFMYISYSSNKQENNKITKRWVNDVHGAFIFFLLGFVSFLIGWIFLGTVPCSFRG